MNRLSGGCLSSGQRRPIPAAAALGTSTAHWGNWSRPVDTDRSRLEPLSAWILHPEHGVNKPDVGAAGGAGERCSCSKALWAERGSGSGAAPGFLRNLSAPEPPG